MLTLILFCVFGFLVWFLFRDTDVGLPPGPRGIPGFGYLLFLSISSPETTLGTLSKKYGKIMTVPLGTRKCVVVSDFTLLKEMFSKLEASGRPDLYGFKMFSKINERQGVILSDGYRWQELRRFSLRHLKDFGMGKSTMNDLLSLEADHFMKRLHEQEEKPFDFTRTLEVCILNIIWNILTGVRIAEEDPEFLYLLDNVNMNLESFTIVLFISLLSNSLINLIPGRIYGLPRMIEADRRFREYLKKMVQDVKDSYDPNHHRHLLDYYVTEMKKEIEKDGKQLFTEDELVFLVGDLFVAGAETTTTTIRFAVLYLVHHPEIQGKLYEEIKEVVGRSRRPILEDRYKLQYMEAFISEVQRKASIVPLGIFHRTTANVKIAGYNIPEDTIIIPNLDFIHKDPTYWDNPEEFHPERFLNDQKECLANPDGFAPFSLGKRRCLGEQLARAELFLFISYLIQDFTLECVSGERPPQISRIQGIVTHPGPYQIIFKPRKP